VQIPEVEATKFEVPGVHYRKLTKVIRSAFMEDDDLSFHTSPFTQWWQPSEDEDAIRVYGEMYTSDAMLEAHAEVQAIPFEPGQSHVESVVAGVMLWSDSTHLASFGMALLWPVYLFFANLCYDFFHIQYIITPPHYFLHLH
jgi:Plavaka transposase